MNQILSTSNNYNEYNKDDTKKIIRIFCIIIVIVAIVIAALAIKRIQRVKNEQASFAKPVISIERTNNEQLAIKATCDDGINYVVYTWNYNNEKRINVGGSTTFEELVDIPYSQASELQVQVVSRNNVAEITETIKRDGVDKTKPEITAITVVGSKLSIKALDESGIKYLEYQWEGKDAQTVYFDEDDNKDVTVDLDIDRGTFKLTITVEDIFENKEVISRLVTGVNEPEIDVIRYGGSINITVTHDMGICEIGVLINEKFYSYNKETEGYSKDKTTVELEYPLEEGENTIKIIAYSFEKLSPQGEDSTNNYSSKFFIGQCTYDENEE